MSFLVKRGIEKESAFRRSWYVRRYMSPAMRRMAEKEYPTDYSCHVQHGFKKKSNGSR